MQKTGKPTAELRALWRHIRQLDRFERVDPHIMDEGRRTLSKLQRLPIVRQETRHRPVVGVLHAIVEGHAVRLG